MAKSISKNYLYNMSYQLLTLLTPFITTPYLARVLEPQGIGLYSYTTSIVAYFILLASLGIANYAQREIAYQQNDRYLQSRTFYEVNLLQLILVGVSLLSYYLLVSQLSGNHLIYWIQALNIIAVIFDITWFFQGLEEFGKIVLRNFVIRIMTIILIFLLIHTPDDLYKYIFLLGMMNILSALSIWFYLPQYLTRVSRKSLCIFRNFPIIIQLFLPQVAIQLYTVLDKTMIGVITGSPLENGYYEQAEKIIKLSLTVVTSLGVVMLPRIASSFSQGKLDVIRRNMMQSYRFVLFLTLPMFFGFIAISHNFVPWFFGPGYDKVIPLMQILSMLVIAIGLSNVTGIQYLLATNQQNKLTLSVVCGAVVNFILNLLLIPQLQSIGAAIASLIAECVVTLAQFYIVRQVFPLSAILPLAKKYFLSAAIMFALLQALNQYLRPDLFHLALTVVVGILSYTILLLIFKDEMLSWVINKIRSKIHQAHP